MSKYPGAKFAREFRRKRNAKPTSFSATRNFGLRRKSVRSSKLCPLGEIVLKAKIAFQKVMGEMYFTGDLVWVKLKWTRPWFWLFTRMPRDAPAPRHSATHPPRGFTVPRACFHDAGRPPRCDSGAGGLPGRHAVVHRASAPPRRSPPRADRALHREVAPVGARLHCRGPRPEQASRWAGRLHAEPHARSQRHRVRAAVQGPQEHVRHDGRGAASCART